MIRKNQFSGWHPRLLLGSEIEGAQLGIIGYGRIGSAVGRKARALGMKVEYWSPSHQSSKIESLDHLLRTSDYISIHCPLF